MEQKDTQNILAQSAMDALVCTCVLLVRNDFQFKEEDPPPTKEELKEAKDYAFTLCQQMMEQYSARAIAVMLKNSMVASKANNDNGEGQQ